MLISCNLMWHLKFLNSKYTWSNFGMYAVKALIDIKKSLIDPSDKLRNWNKGDPCAENWTGVRCFDKKGDDGYFHIRELYGFFYHSVFFLFCISTQFNFFKLV